MSSAAKPERRWFTRTRTEHHPGRYMSFGKVWWPWRTRGFAFWVTGLLAMVAVGMVLQRMLFWIHPDASAWHFATLWGLLALPMFYMLTRRDELRVDFDPPQLLERRRRFGWWSERRVPLRLRDPKIVAYLGENTDVAQEARSKAKAVSPIVCRLELRTSGKTRVLIEDDSFSRRSVRRVAQQLATGLGIELTDELDDPMNIKVLLPSTRPEHTAAAVKRVQFGLSNYWLWVIGAWPCALFTGGLSFILLNVGYPISAQLRDGVGVILALACLLAPFLVRMPMGWGMKLPYEIDLESRTLRIDTMRWGASRALEYSLDSEEVYLFMRMMVAKPGALNYKLRISFQVCWSLAGEHEPLMLLSHPSTRIDAADPAAISTPPRFVLGLNPEEDLEARMKDTLELADLLGLEIELVGQDTIEAYQTQKKKLAETP